MEVLFIIMVGFIQPRGISLVFTAVLLVAKTLTFIIGGIMVLFDFRGNWAINKSQQKAFENTHFIAYNVIRYAWFHEIFMLLFIYKVLSYIRRKNIKRESIKK